MMAWGAAGSVERTVGVRRRNVFRVNFRVIRLIGTQLQLLWCELQLVRSFISATPSFNSADRHNETPSPEYVAELPR